MHVATFEQLSRARVLLESKKVHIDFRGMYGNTAVHYSAARGHNEFIRFCTTEFNANVLIPNNANELVQEVARADTLSWSRDDNWDKRVALNAAAKEI